MRRGYAFIARALALTLVAALVGATPAVAEPVAPLTEQLPPGVAPLGGSGPAAPSKTADPSPPSGQSSSRRSTAGDLPVAVDAKTKAFRDKLNARQARLEAIKAQLVELDTQAEIAGEAYNQAKDRLDTLRSQLATTQGDLEKAKKAYQVQADLLAARANDLYREGGSQTVIEVVLGARSIPDFVQRLQFLGVIGQADADLALQLANQRDAIAKNADDLDLQRQQAEALDFDLAARKREIELRIADRQAMLASTEKDLLAMLDSEAARRANDESALYASVVAGVRDKGIQVDPGSPVETALAYHGVPYLWGGTAPTGFDCSGLVMFVYAQHGVPLPHYSGSQFLLGAKVGRADLLPGDLVFFGSPIHHVGMYIGGGYFIEAPHTGDFVKISKLSSRGNYAGARRYAWTTRVGDPAGLDRLSPDVDHSHGLQGVYGGVR